MKCSWSPLLSSVAWFHSQGVTLAFTQQKNIALILVSYNINSTKSALLINIYKKKVHHCVPSLDFSIKKGGTWTHLQYLLHPRSYLFVFKIPRVNTPFLHLVSCSSVHSTSNPSTLYRPHFSSNVTCVLSLLLLIFLCVQIYIYFLFWNLSILLTLQTSQREYYNV